MITGHLLKLKDEPTGATIEVAVADLVIAGWTGRDAAAVEAHIAELEAIGVPRPASVPCFYRVAAALLTTAEEIQAPGPDSSGEVEFVLFGAAPRKRLRVGAAGTQDAGVAGPRKKPGPKHASGLSRACSCSLRSFLIIP